MHRKRPRKILRLFAGALLTLLVSAPLLVLLLALQGEARVRGAPPLSAEEVGRIERLLIDSAPGGALREGTRWHEVRLDEEQLNLLLRYSIEVLSLDPGWAAQTRLSAGGLEARLSVQAVRWPMTLHLNVRGDFVAEGGRLQLQEEMQVGELRVPQALLQHAVAGFERRLARDNAAYYDIKALVSAVQEVRIVSYGSASADGSYGSASADGSYGSASADGSEDEASMVVTLNWDPDLINRLGDAARKLFFSSRDRARILVYYQHIGEVAATIPDNLRAVSLTTFLAPLFAQAAAHSAAGADPVAENRALFQALTVYINNEDIAELVGPEAATETEPPYYIEVRLQRRHDLARHLVAIAAITGSAGADIASLLSTTKEVYDARHRSGFSFSDLTANTVGVTLASLATRDRASALEMQRRLAQVSRETDYMPDLTAMTAITEDGGDNLNESDFNAKYADRDSPEYRQRLAEIEALIAARPVFLGL